MNIKIFLASLIVALALSLAAFVSNFHLLFPPLLATFLIALISGCLCSFWVCSAGSMPTFKLSRRKPRKTRRPHKPVNGGARETGSVKWFSAKKGFGFITRDSGDDVFVHFRSVTDSNGQRMLQEGQRVEFIVTESAKGLQAEDVAVIK